MSSNTLKINANFVATTCTIRSFTPNYGSVHNSKFDCGSSYGYEWSGSMRFDVFSLQNDFVGVQYCSTTIDYKKRYTIGGIDLFLFRIAKQRIYGNLSTIDLIKLSSDIATNGDLPRSIRLAVMVSVGFILGYESATRLLQALRNANINNANTHRLMLELEAAFILGRPQQASLFD